MNSKISNAAGPAIASGPDQFTSLVFPPLPPLTPTTTPPPSNTPPALATVPNQIAAPQLLILPQSTAVAPLATQPAGMPQQSSFQQQPTYGQPAVQPVYPAGIAAAPGQVPMLAPGQQAGFPQQPAYGQPAEQQIYQAGAPSLIQPMPSQQAGIIQQPGYGQPAPLAPGQVPMVGINPLPGVLQQPGLPPAPAAPVINPQIAETKSAIGNYQDTIDSLIPACAEGIKLLPTLTEIEKNKGNPTSMLSLLRKSMPKLYSQREHLSLDAVTQLKDVFQQAQSNPLLSDIVTQEWVTAITTLSLVLTANSQQDRIAKVQGYSTLLDSMTTKAGLFEQNLLINGITDIFINRQDYKGDELSAAKALFDKIISDPIKAKKIFQPDIMKQFSAWNVILEAHLALAAPADGKSFMDQITLYQNLVDNISSPDAQVEIKMFANNLSKLFTERGNFMSQDLTNLQALLTKMKAQRNFLSLNQKSIVTEWMKEITFALSVVKAGTACYIEALINQPDKKAQINNIARAANLFTPATVPSLRNKLITQLNTVLKARAQDNQSVTDVVKLLKYLYNKQVQDKGPLLSDQQRNALLQWIKLFEEQDATALQNNKQLGTPASLV